MVANLTKGQEIDLNKARFDLSTLTIGLGWDRQRQQAEALPLGRASVASVHPEYDLDSIALLLDETGKVANFGTELDLDGQKIGLFQSDLIFFNNISAPSGTGPSAAVFGGKSAEEIKGIVHKLIAQGEYIVHAGDNLTGAGAGDDEQLIVVLERVPARIQSIVFLVCIYQGRRRNQSFGQLSNAFIRAVDAKGQEIVRYALSGMPEYNAKRSVVFAEVYREGSGWRFRALGQPEDADNFLEILKKRFVSKVE